MTTVGTPPRLAAGLRERKRALRAFVASESVALSSACHAMARSFSRGGSLLAFGTGAAATDAAHVAVEFMHPVIVGKRALPALALSNDPSGASSVSALARPDDIALAISHGSPGQTTLDFLEAASARGLLTIAMTGPGSAVEADYCFSVPSEDTAVVQEVHETAYHVLWELTHVFFEHPGLLDDACITCGDVAVTATVVAVRGSTAMIERDNAREEVAIELIEEVKVGDELLCHAGVALERLKGHDAPPTPAEETAFLYPFLASEERDLDAVLSDIRRSTLQKADEVMAVRGRLDPEAIERCAAAIGERLRAGARLFSFGNGGSSTDAQDLATDCLDKGWPAAALTNDAATMTAIGNDVGFENTFSRQLIALGRAGDVAIAISTSGDSPDLVSALEEAHHRQMITVAILGNGGGRIASLPLIDHTIIVDSDYIPRIQEAQATVYHSMLDAIGPAEGKTA